MQKHLKECPPPLRQTCNDALPMGTLLQDYHVTFPLHLQGAIPPGEMPTRFQVHAKTVDGGDEVVYCTDDIPMTPDSNGRVFIQLSTSTMSVSCRRHHSSSLEPHRKYKTVITSKNEAGGRNSTGDIQFSKPLCVVGICKQCVSYSGQYLLFFSMTNQCL